jgi:SAM-dependent MidA family methyltransferase
MFNKIKSLLENAPDQKLSFFEYMNLALYAPDIGYYSSNFPKIGSSGDFITAPQLTPLFAEAIATQSVQIFKFFKGRCDFNFLELGAGTGKFAVDFLLAAQKMGITVSQYFILEVSPGLRALQKEYCAAFPGVSEKIFWITELPKKNSFHGLIFANEVLDAMPVHRFLKKNGNIFEQSVQIKSQIKSAEDPKQNLAFPELEYGDPLMPSEELFRAVQDLEFRLGPFPEDYCSEINLWLKPWMHSLSEVLEQGAVLLIDYGYAEAEYYSPLRSSGTLCCYSKHRAHSDPLLNPGEQDITAHVNFSELAAEGIASGLELMGYTTQALFLANLIDPEHVTQAQDSQHLRRLMHPEAMGEIFKVIGFHKNLNMDEHFSWKGFHNVDQRYRL